jgi:uncharacterized OB-fold protein
VGARCRDCGELAFPYRERCPACARTGAERTLLPRRGTLWTWTVQGFPPPGLPPEDFTPYGVGYVELPGCLRVETRLLGDPSAFRLGIDLELVPFGNSLYAFQPV